MKKILFILLLFPLSLSAQTYFPVDNLNVKNILRIGSWYIVKSNDSIWIEKPLGTFQNRIDTTRSGGGYGSPVYASNGVYKDGNTVKLGGRASSDIIIVGNTGGGGNVMTLGDDVTGSIDSAWNSVNIHVTDGSDLVKITTDYTGVHYTATPDTTLTTPSHLMTEQQVKREINAVDGGWRQRADATVYSFENGNDSIVIINSDGESNAAFIFYAGGEVVHSLDEGGNTNFLGMSVNGLAIANDYFKIRPQSSYFNIGKKYSTSIYSGLFLDDNDTLKFGRYSDINSVNQGDYFYTTKSGSIGIISNNVKTYDVDSVGHVSFKGTYASIYRHKSLGDTTQSIPAGTTPTKVLAFSNNGQSSNCTADKTNDQIVITKTGMYYGYLHLSYASGSATVNWTAYFFGNNVEIQEGHSTGYTSTANDKRSTSIPFQFYVSSVPYYLDYRVTHDGGSFANLILTYSNLGVNYIGD